MYDNVVIYAYNESDQTRRENLEFFIKNAYRKNILFLIVINGEKWTVRIPNRINIKVLQRENTGFDFAGYYEGIKYTYEKLKLNPKYFFFLNTSCRGPFIPKYITLNSWLEPFINISQQDNAAIVSSTINIYHGTTVLQPHCQTYAFLMTDKFVKQLLNDKNDSFFNLEKITSCTTKKQVVDKYEIYLSTYALRNGFNISCLIPEYRFNYLDSENIKVNPSAIRMSGDIVHPYKLCYGRQIHPYEVVFIKTNRNFDPMLIKSLSI